MRAVPYLRGTFFGTDFNFLYSIDMQKEIASNCLNASYDSLMNFDNYVQNSQYDDLRMFIGSGGQVLNMDAEMDQVVLEAFKGTRKFHAVGVSSFMFYFFAIWTFV